MFLLTTSAESYGRRANTGKVTKRPNPSARPPPGLTLVSMPAADVAAPRPFVVVRSVVHEYTAAEQAVCIKDILRLSL